MYTELGWLGGFGFLFINMSCLWWAKRSREMGKRLQEESEKQAELVRRELEAERRDALARLKEELHKKRVEASAQMRKEQHDLERTQLALQSRVEKVQEREAKVEEAQQAVHQRERATNRLADQVRMQEQRVKILSEDLTAKLESVSCMTKEDARKALLKMLEDDVYHSQKKLIQKSEEEARQAAKERSAQILIDAMQRHASEHAANHTVGVVQLPHEEMKGRIIGKDGRNIKALEMATGMEFIIGESPESITISGFNPIRREIARRSLERLLKDGRINPTRIEETVHQCEQELDAAIIDHGRTVIMDFNLSGVKPEMVELLGKLNFRTSYSQNVLTHSVEVALFARMIAEELGLPNPELALRGGLFHDIGKALPAEMEGTHALLGADVARRCGEDDRIVNAIAAHHEEVPFTSLIGPVVMIADTISASRPGARRETLSTYLKRLEKLEEIAYAFEGVKRAYALQAGREIRILVEEDILDDERAHMLAHTIARKIEHDMAFPGQIKVNVIREKRSVEYAK